MVIGANLLPVSLTLALALVGIHVVVHVLGALVLALLAALPIVVVRRIQALARWWLGDGLFLFVGRDANTGLDDVSVLLAGADLLLDATPLDTLVGWCFAILLLEWWQLRVILKNVVTKVDILLRLSCSLDLIRILVHDILDESLLLLI